MLRVPSIIMNKYIGIKKRICGILKSKNGFSLSELLIAVLIMALATATLTSAMILAFRHFYESTQRTEAQFLCASLAEFVEDELLFSKVKVTGGDVTWSKGTHNMGSDISFYVNTEDGSYVKVDGSTLNQYGKIVITGNNYSGNYYKIASDGSYDVETGKGYSLLAGMSLTWDDANGWFVVQIVVVDKDDKTVLSDDSFTVKPAVGTV